MGTTTAMTPTETSTRDIDRDARPRRRQSIGETTTMTTTNDTTAESFEPDTAVDDEDEDFNDDDEELMGLIIDILCLRERAGWRTTTVKTIHRMIGSGEWVTIDRNGFVTEEWVRRDEPITLEDVREAMAALRRRGAFR
jgi:hypothetical protein